MIITVVHDASNGWHTFSCPQVPGFSLLCEVDDLAEAYAQVPDAIAEIVEADEGFPVEVILEDTYSEYVAKLPEEMQPSMRHYSIKKAA